MHPGKSQHERNNANRAKENNATLFLFPLLSILGIFVIHIESHVAAAGCSIPKIHRPSFSWGVVRDVVAAAVITIAIAWIVLLLLAVVGDIVNINTNSLSVMEATFMQRIRLVL